MNKTEIIRNIFMWGGLIGCFVLLFAGFRAPTKELKKDNGPSKIPKKTLIRSTLMLVGAVLCLAVFTVATNYADYQNGLASFSDLVLAHFENIIIKFGWIALFPWLYNVFSKNKRAPEEDADEK